MASLDASRMTKWLGITNQQFNILEAMLSLGQKSSQASPKAVIEEDAALRNAVKIQKSNFFAQLKSLRSRGYVKKVGSAAYAVDFESISSALDKAEAVATKEASEINVLKAEAARRFKSTLARQKETSVEFLDYNTMYTTIADMTRAKNILYGTVIFPKLFYAQSPSLMYQPDAQRYSQTLWMRCITEGTLEMKALTSFDIDYLFKKFQAAYKNPTLAYEEVKIILKNIPDVLEKTKTLEVYYTELPYGLDLLLPHDERTEEIFLQIRDTNKIGKGCVHIHSPELAMKFREIFLDECKESINMKGDKGRKVMSKLESDLEMIYQKARAKKAEE
jgi:ribosomal protein S20